SVEPAAAAVVGAVMLRQLPGWGQALGIALVTVAAIGAARTGRTAEVAEAASIPAPGCGRGGAGALPRRPPGYIPRPCQPSPSWSQAFRAGWARPWSVPRRRSRRSRWWGRWLVQARPRAVGT